MIFPQRLRTICVDTLLRRWWYLAGCSIYVASPVEDTTISATTVIQSVGFYSHCGNDVCSIFNSGDDLLTGDPSVSLLLSEKRRFLPRRRSKVLASILIAVMVQYLLSWRRWCVSVCSTNQYVEHLLQGYCLSGGGDDLLRWCSSGSVWWRCSDLKHTLLFLPISAVMISVSLRCSRQDDLFTLTIYSNRFIKEYLRSSRPLNHTILSYFYPGTNRCGDALV